MFTLHHLVIVTLRLRDTFNGKLRDFIFTGFSTTPLHSGGTTLCVHAPRLGQQLEDDQAHSSERRQNMEGDASGTAISNLSLQELNMVKEQVR